MGIREPAAKSGLAVLIFFLGVLVSGCMQATTEPAFDANFTPRDRKLLAFPPYEQARIREQFLRHIVDYGSKRRVRS